MNKTDEQNDTKYKPHELQKTLTQHSGKRVLLMITDNSRSMLTVKPDGGGVVIVRAHHMFLDSPPEIVGCMIDWIRGKKADKDLIRNYIGENDSLIRSTPETQRNTVIRVEGRHYNLREIFRHVNDSYLDGRAKAEVTWGRRSNKRRTNSVRLGCYDPMRNLITMSRRLDRSDIPRYMIEYVMFHEMLHEILGIGERADGKRNIHGSTFKLMEQTYPFYEKALAFEKQKWG